MDEDILRTVEKISGKLSRDCYYDLCCLVKAAIPRMPGTFSMETLYPEAQRYSEKEKDTLAKALSRAAEDIWDCGDRAELQKLFQRVLWEKPTPKDLVRVLALSVWRRRKAVRPQVRYQVLETRHPRRFGFSGESWEPERHLVVLLPGREQAEVEQLVRRLNQRQIPIQEAEEEPPVGGSSSALRRVCYRNCFIWAALASSVCSSRSARFRISRFPPA